MPGFAAGDVKLLRFHVAAFFFGGSVELWFVAERDAVFCNVSAVGHFVPLGDVMRIEFFICCFDVRRMSAPGAAVAVSFEDSLAELLAYFFFVVDHDGLLWGKGIKRLKIGR